MRWVEFQTMNWSERYGLSAVASRSRSLETGNRNSPNPWGTDDSLRRWPQAQQGRHFLSSVNPSRIRPRTVRASHRPSHNAPRAKNEKGASSACRARVETRGAHGCDQRQNGGPWPAPRSARTPQWLAIFTPRLFDFGQRRICAETRIVATIELETARVQNRFPVVLIGATTSASRRCQPKLSRGTGT